MPLDVYEVLDPPVRDGLSACAAGGRASGLKVLEPLPVLVVLGPLLRPKLGDASPAPEPPPPPVVVGLITPPPPPPRLGPMLVGIADGFTALATRLKAVMHCSTWAGSLDSYKSTVRKRSCAGMFSGGISQALRKCEMFSICMKGIADFLNRTPGEGTARLMSLRIVSTRDHMAHAIVYLHSAVPSFSASSRSPGGRRSPSTSSIQLRTSLAAFGV